MREAVSVAIGIMLLVMAGGYYGWEKFQERLHEEGDYVNSTVESSKAAIEYLNAIRAAHGRPPVEWSGLLYQIALARLEDMYIRDYCGHFDPITQKDMLGEYLTQYPYKGECLLCDSHNEKEALDGFYESAPHRFGMLDKLMTHAAIACKYKMCVLILAKMDRSGGDNEAVGG